MKNTLNNLLVQQLYRVFIQLYIQIVRGNKCFYCFFRGHGNKSCNLIGSLPGQYFPISAHGPR